MEPSVDFLMTGLVGPGVGMGAKPGRDWSSARLRSRRSMVGVKGLEPSTSWSQTRRASQLRHTPTLLALFKAKRGLKSTAAPPDL